MTLRRLKHIFTPDRANSASLRLIIFGKTQPRRFSIMFTIGPNESNKKETQELVKRKICCPCIEMRPRRLNDGFFFFTADTAKPASLRLEVYRLDLSEEKT